MQAQLLAPATVLVLWTFVMLFWMAGTRLPAMKQLGGGLGKAKPGGRGQDLEGKIPDSINWKSHNHTHLMEQPTLFYATVAIIAILGVLKTGAAYSPIDPSVRWPSKIITMRCLPSQLVQPWMQGSPAWWYQSA